MILTREQALQLHRQMWTDMKNADVGGGFFCRVMYKENWCRQHFPNEHIANSCFLCEYVFNPDTNDTDCSRCLIDWGVCDEERENACVHAD